MLEDAIKRYGLFILMSTLVFSIFFSDGGVLGYIKTKMEIKKVNAEMQKLEKENTLLLREIEKLQKNDDHLEDVLRSKYGLLRDGEILYVIEKEK